MKLAYRMRAAATCSLIAISTSAGFAQTAPVTAMPPLPPIAPAIDRFGINLTEEGGSAEPFVLPALEIGNEYSSLEYKIYANTTEYTGGKLRFQLVPIYSGGFLVARVASMDGAVHVFSLGTLNATVNPAGFPAWQFFPSGTATTTSGTDLYASITDDGTQLMCWGGDASSLYEHYSGGSWIGGKCAIITADGSKATYILPNGTTSDPSSSYLDMLLNYNSSASATVDSDLSTVEMPDGQMLTKSSVAGELHLDSSLGFRMYIGYSSYPYKVISERAANLSKEYAAPTADSSTLSASALSMTQVTTTGAIYSNGIKLYTIAGNTGIQFPSGRTITYAAGDGTADTAGPNPDVTVKKNKVITDGSGTTTYSWGEEPGSHQQNYPTIWYWKYDNPDQSHELYKVYNGAIVWKLDGLNRTTIYNYSGLDGIVWGFSGLASNPQLAGIVHPNSPTLTWTNGNPSSTDSRGTTTYVYTHGVVSQVTDFPIDGSASTSIKYGITLTCDATNYKICNKPQYKIDQNIKQTDYVWSTVHGGLLKETLPADSNGVQPQKRYTYTPLYPKVLNSSGVLVNLTPVWRVTGVSECAVATAANPASCVGTKDERVTTYAYNDNNLFLTSVTVAAGDNSTSETTSYKYDYAGNVTSVDGPRTDVDDRTYTEYDALRRKVFEISADADGGGPLPRQITRHVYDIDGNETRTEYGTGFVTDGSDFTLLHFKRMTFDPTTGLMTKVEEVQP